MTPIPLSAVTPTSPGAARPPSLDPDFAMLLSPNSPGNGPDSGSARVDASVNGRRSGAALDPDFQVLLPKSTSPSPPLGSDILRNIALAGRDVGEGVFDTLAAPHDVSTGITNWARGGINRLFGAHLPMAPTFSGGLSSALTSAGAPVPTTPREKLAASVIRGGAGALTGAGVLGLGSSAVTRLPNLVRAGASGITGGASSDLARQAGAGPVGQFVAGLAGGLTPSAFEAGLGTVGAVARPLTRGGQAQLAANILRRGATNPTQAASNLDSAAPLVPGSARTAGEASGDTGVLALEKGVRARNPGKFGERISQQNAARQTELANLGGTPADIEAAERLRETQTAPMRENAFANANGPVATQDVHAAIDQILESPAGARESIGKAMRWAKGLIGDHDDPETLYEVRKDLALAQQDRLQPSGRDAPNATMLAQSRGQLGKVIQALDNSIETAAPGYKAYLQRYAQLSEPINQMEAIQALQQKASSGLDTSTGEQFLSAPQFARQLQGVQARTAGPLPLRLTPQQTQRLEAMREDLQRGNALSSPTVKPPGSDTFQNFMTGRRLGPLGHLVSHVPLIGKALRGVGEFVDQRVNNQLTNAMLDPAYAASLIRRGIPLRPFGRTLVGTVGRSALPLPAAVGPTSALPAPLPARVPLPALSAPRVQAQASVGSPRPMRGPIFVRRGPGRHSAILPPSFPGGTPQQIDGLLGMR